MASQRLLLLIFACAGLQRAAAVCYGDLGCFENNPPFHNAAKQVPQAPAQVGTKLLLYKKASKNGPAKELSYSDMNIIKASGFDATLPVNIIVHGFGENENSNWMNKMKNAYLDTLNCNVIVVGWGPGAAKPVYSQAAANTRLVGRQVAKLVKLLVQGGSNLQKVHIVGFSLGAHVAGYAGAELGGKIQRITGLDPAGPFFDGQDIQVRLDTTDAQFVDVIHTNGAPLTQGGAGMASPIGHVDFYPNGGASQPGCPPLVKGSLDAILSGDIKDVGTVLSCSHRRAHELYIESIVSAACKFTAYTCPGGFATFQAGKCTSCAPGCSEMGYRAKSTVKGSMYLTTTGAAPYCNMTPVIG